MSAPLQSISISRTENRSLPTPHVVYAIVIALPVRSWTVYRRYSEFVALHQSFINVKSVAKAPPAPLPPKNSARKTLNAVTGLGGLLGRGESGREQDEAILQQRRTALETYLRAIVSSHDPVWRESDEFCAFIELPKGQGSASLFGVSSPDGATRRSGQQRYVPGAYSASSTHRQQNGTMDGISERSTGLTTRTLGAAPVRESQATRTLDDRGLMSGHQEQMDAQDRQLDGLAAILRRQKAMGLAINQELTEQSDLLDDLDQHVDRTQSKMRTAEKQMDRL